ncbi:hypothetical protein LOTGIDRAFT_167516 [Lottia gigantea]|uniref:Uncharacterized protein n=1 Tax=Lottia gigantea TaxID=225164 RepID=V3ZNX2_LOTGI|nr:hypothetical protein LOTGIDRAFT_167516 [Lottia gigantea]ESO86012.1 hypothetical protein LOTGIDRAFT_167516 [Lottia gigantea]
MTLNERIASETTRLRSLLQTYQTFLNSQVASSTGLLKEFYQDEAFLNEAALLNLDLLVEQLVTDPSKTVTYRELIDKIEELILETAGLPARKRRSALFKSELGLGEELNISDRRSASSEESQDRDRRSASSEESQDRDRRSASSEESQDRDRRSASSSSSSSSSSSEESIEIPVIPVTTPEPTVPMTLDERIASETTRLRSLLQTYQTFLNSQVASSTGLLKEFYQDEAFLNEAALLNLDILVEQLVTDPSKTVTYRELIDKIEELILETAGLPARKRRSVVFKSLLNIR